MNFTIPSYPELSYGTLFCIGKNYALHIEEMKSSPSSTPVVFLKSRNSIILSGEQIVIPSVSQEIHHEVELVLLISEPAQNVPPSSALHAVGAYAVGIDVTARDLQSTAKKKGLPWALAKGFQTFSPIGNFIPYSGRENLQEMEIMIRVNDEVRQKSNTSHMLFSCAEIISYLSKHFTLQPGDLIFTGTPEGVSQIKPGDHISATLDEGKSVVEVDVIG